MNKEKLQKVADKCDFLAKYITLPCLVVSLVMMPFSLLVSHSLPLFAFYLFMTMFNLFAHWLNTTTRDRALEAIEMINSLERKQRVQDLNPHKR
jgi:hypothetical protein